MATTEPSKRTVFAIIFAASVLCNWLSLEVATPGNIGPNTLYLLAEATGTAVSVALISLGFHYWKSARAAYICGAVLNIAMAAQNTRTGEELSLAQQIMGFAIAVLIIGAVIYAVGAPIVSMIRLWFYKEQNKNADAEE